MLKVNGKAYDWGDVDLKIPGLNIQVQEISYDDELEIEEVYGSGSKPRGYGTGNYKASGKLSMLRDDYDDLLAYCNKVCFRMAQYYIEAGMDVIAVVDPLISQISTDHFEQFMADKEVKYESDTRRALNRIKEAARADLYEESLAAEIEAIEAGIRDDKATNLQTYKREIMETLNGAVILRYSYAEGVTEHTLTEDREVHRAVALLDDGKEYARILHEQDTVRK